MKLQCLQMAQMFRVKLTAKTCKKDSCCILLIGDKTADETQCQHTQRDTHGKNNMNYSYIVIGHELAITTQESGLGAIFGGQKKRIAN